jgi:hypothetical protein
MERPRAAEVTADRLDRVSFALADSTGRSLLDRPYLSDGQRLGQLAEDFVMSRQAVNSTSRCSWTQVSCHHALRGARDRYFLNRAPIRAAQDLRIEKYTATRVRVDGG